MAGRVPAIGALAVEAWTVGTRPSILPPGKGTWQPPGVVLAAH